jgi:hypothetical protein
MSYSVFDSFNLSQLGSRTVSPELIPSICVCTAPATPTVQRSLPEPVTLGVIALPGGEITLVFVSASVVTVLLLLLSVFTLLVVCANAVSAVVIIISVNNTLNTGVSKIYVIYSLALRCCIYSTFFNYSA